MNRWSWMALVAAACGALGTSGAPTTQPASQPARHAPPREVGRVDSPLIPESSGLAASYANPGLLWTHNDSGDTARLFLLETSGRLRAVCTIEGAAAEDWEDMASFRLDGQSWLIVADMGDNAHARDSCTLYLLPEPVLPGAVRPASTDGAAAPARLTARVAVAIEFAYAEGPHDGEAVAVDVVQRKILLLTKVRLPDKPARLYELDLPDLGAAASRPASPGRAAARRPDAASPVLRPRAVAELRLGAVTAMDLSPDGRRAVITSYFATYEFDRAAAQTWGQALSGGGRAVPTPARPKGEGVCYSTDGRSIFFSSEGRSQPLWETPTDP